MTLNSIIIIIIIINIIEACCYLEFGTEKTQTFFLHENTSMKILEMKKDLIFELNKKTGWWVGLNLAEPFW